MSAVGMRHHTRSASFLAVLVVTVALSACSTDQPKASHTSAPAGAAPHSSSGRLGDRTVLPLLTASQLMSTAVNRATVELVGATYVVAKDVTDTVQALRSVVLAFAAVPDGVCVERAEVSLSVVADKTMGPVRIYPSAALSLARGRTPPASSGGPGVLLDNRPAADGQLDDEGQQQMFDVTELVRLWAVGGPFPSRERRIPAGSPVVMHLRVPDLSSGAYITRYRTGDCPGFS